MGSKGLHSGESTRLPPMWCGFKSRRRRHMWVQFVVGSLPPRGFSPGTSVFPSPQKTNTSKFQYDQKSGRRRTTLWMCYPQNHYLFILFIYQMLLLLSTKDTERLGFTTVTLCHYEPQGRFSCTHQGSLISMEIPTN